MDKLNNEIIKEARRLEEDITYSSKSRFNMSNFWHYIHGFFGVAIIIGSISLGALSFANLENQFLINLSSLAVIILSILQVFFNPSEKYHMNKNIGDEYNKLRQEIRFFYNFEFYKNDLNANINMIKKFAEEKSKLDYNSSPVPGWIYNRAKKSIEKEEHKYEVDK